MSRTWIGIDPGVSGAVAVIYPDGIVRFHDTPFLLEKKGSLRRSPDDAGMAAILRLEREDAKTNRHDPFVVLEKVNAMPSIGKGGERRTAGAASMFSFGMGYGIWRGIVRALELPHTLVHPARWKGAVLADTPKGDGAACAHAGRLYPAIAGMLRGPKGGLMMGRVDALLLAHYGLTVFGNNG